MKRYTQPSAMSGLVEQALARHGISRQVTSAMIVREANMLLQELIDDFVHQDVRVVSFRFGELHVACRHAPAVYMAKSFMDQLKDQLERRFPQTSIQKIHCRQTLDVFLDTV